MTGDGTEARTNTAGLVLLWPFLPTLFERLELLGPAQSLPEAHVPKAAQILRHISHGDGHLDVTQDQLILTLVGQAAPLDNLTNFDVTSSEQELVQSLLRSVIAQWSQLGETSVEGFRESFLRRSGLLRFAGGEVHLSVESAAYDMLLDALPWAYSPCILRWARMPIHVEWR